jgi:hypothetical protein
VKPEAKLAWALRRQGALSQVNPSRKIPSGLAPERLDLHLHRCPRRGPFVR